jgi:hypothetical protein
MPDRQEHLAAGNLPDEIARCGDMLGGASALVAGCPLRLRLSDASAGIISLPRNRYPHNLLDGSITSKPPRDTFCIKPLTQSL